jgi:L-alanine-DL-glutamate epimerase-like enolase superfamily enzyme
LRDVLAGPLLPLQSEDAVVPDAPGLGYRPDVDAIKDLRVQHSVVTAMVSG